MALPPRPTAQTRENDLYTMVLDGEPHWGALERLVEGLRERGRTLRHDDCMYMGREVSPGCPDIHLYEAIDTRRYPNFDDHGGAYWYQGPTAAGPMELDTPVDYMRVPTVDPAVRWARS